MNSLERTTAISVDKFEWASVMYWLIHLGNLARLSARANRCRKCVRNGHSTSCPAAYLVRKHHQPPIRFTSQYTSNTLRSMTHGIESEVIVFLNSVVITKELKSGLRSSVSSARLICEKRR